MTNTEDTVRALTALVVFLIERVREVTASAETMHALLVHHGVVSPDIYDATYSQALKCWDRALGAAMTEGETLAADAAIQRLLASLALPEQ